MYRWRKMTDQQRSEVLQERYRHQRPPHSIPHVASDTTTYFMVTAACFEHKPIVGYSPQRMSQFEHDLTQVLAESCQQVFAWNLMPNHYHALIDTPDIRTLLTDLGKLHGRNSFYWNGEESRRGRQVWCNAAETAMKSVTW